MSENNHEEDDKDSQQKLKIQSHENYYIQIKWTSGKEFKLHDLSSSQNIDAKTMEIYTHVLRRAQVEGGLTPKEVSERVFQAQADFRKKAKSKPAIKRAPGYRLYGLLTLICPKRFVERELSALLADGNERFQEELQARRFWAARITQAALHVWLIWAVCCGAASSLVSVFKGKAQSSE